MTSGSTSPYDPNGPNGAQDNPKSYFKSASQNIKRDRYTNQQMSSARIMSKTRVQPAKMIIIEQSSSPT